VHHAARVAVLKRREELGEEVAGERLGKRVLLVRVGKVLQRGSETVQRRFKDGSRECLPALVGKVLQ